MLIRDLGQVHCRLLPESREISELGKFLREKTQHNSDPYFVIQEKHRGQQARKVVISADVIERMVTQYEFRLGKITVHLSSKLSETEIFLCLKDGAPNTISRFPRSLLQDDNGRESERLFPNGILSQLQANAKVGTRQNLNIPSRRWAGRTPSRQLRQKQWIPPDLSQRPQRAISTYSEKDYVIGDSTPSALRRIANLLTNGPSPKEPTKKEKKDDQPAFDDAYPLPTQPVEMEASPFSTQRTEMEAPAFGAFELDSTPLERTEASTPTTIPYRTPKNTSSTWDQERGKGDRLQADEWIISQVPDGQSSQNSKPKDGTKKNKALKDWNYF